MAAILFVCLGNICRSPLAEGFLGHHLARAGRGDRFTVASAGTGGWHAGEAPDPRTVKAAALYGVDISGQRARQVDQADFAAFDLILGMDRANVEALQALAPAGATARIGLFRDVAFGHVGDVPDPYYSGMDGFEEVARLVYDGCAALAGKFTAS